MLGSGGTRPAIDIDARAGDEPGLLAAQPRDNIADLVRLAEPPDGVYGDDLGEDLGIHLRMGLLLQLSLNWLRVLRSADTSPIAQGVRQQRHTKGEPLEKCEGFSRSTGVGMRLIAMFFGPHAPREQTAQSSVFSHYFKRLERLPKLATSSIGGIFV